MKRLRTWYRSAEVPLLLLMAFGVLWLCYALFDLPTVTDLINLFRDFYNRYGLFVVFAAAIVEGLFMVNFYFPGSFVIVLSVATSDKTVDALAPVAAVIWSGFVIASALNYVIGSFGLYTSLQKLGRTNILRRSRAWAMRYGRRAPYIAAIHPNFLALILVNQGVAKIGFARAVAISALACAFWVMIWTAAVAGIVSVELITNESQPWVILGGLSAWAIFNIVRDELNDDSADSGPNT